MKLVSPLLNDSAPYLRDRTQSDEVKDVSSSSEEKVLYGVPKGSVLGLLLFAMILAPTEDVIKQIREMVSFELGKEIEKDVFCLVTSVGQKF